MKKLLFLFIITSSFLNAQDSIPSIKFETLKTNYKDFVIVKNKIYAITKGDSLVVWDIETNSIKRIKPSINTIAKSNKNNLVVTTLKGEILKSKNGLKWKLKDNFLGEAFSTFITVKNKTIVVASKGIYYENKYHYPKGKNRIFNPKRRSPDTITRYLRKPRFVYLDKKQRLWLDYMNGLGSVEPWFFDVKKKNVFEEEYLHINWHLNYKERKEWNKKNDYKKVIVDSFPNKIKNVRDTLIYKFPAQLPAYNNIKGMTEDKNGNIYISQFGGHMTTDSGISIYSETEFEDFYKDKYLKEILDYHIWTNSRNGKSWEVKNLIEFLGPITYNKFNKSIYFFTNRGFFKLKKENNKYSKELYIRPKGLHLSDGEYELGGYTMVIKKMEFIDEKRFVFLSTINGIGYYDGKQVRIYK